MTAPMQTCYRHHDRRAGVVCQRCDRPICPECMHQASVGFHCPECTKRGAQQIVRPQQLLNKRPVVTQALVAVNALIFALGVGSGLQTRDKVVFGGGLIARAFNPYTQQIIGVAEGEWWRIISSGFLHANIVHVGLNMWVLYSLGRLLEPVLGPVKFSVAYFVAMCGGGLGVMLLQPDALTVGASGAVFGMMGVAAVVLHLRGVNLMASGLGAMIVINLAFTFANPEVSVGGHLGGLVTGVVIGWVYEHAGPRWIKDDALTIATTVALGVVLFGSAVLVAGGA